MTEEMYKRLNNYLNDIFLELNKYDKIFIDNLKSISKLSIIINRYFNDNFKNIENKKIENNLSFNDVYLLSREILKKIDSKYLLQFDNLITNGELNFDYENDDISNFTWSIKNDNIYKEIDIFRRFNYRDICTLIHEFFHYTQVKSSKTTYNCRFFTEFISIYFENIALKYLIEEKNVPIEETEINSRIISLLQSNSSFYNYSAILLAYENLDNIDKNTANNLNKILKFKDNNFEQECLNFLKKLDEINNKKNTKKMAELVNTDYRYIIGTVLAYYALENVKINDMITLNDKINTDEYAYLSIYEILEKIGIEINYETINKSLDTMKKTIFNYGVKTK